MRLTVIPCSYEFAAAFVDRKHRHLKAPRGHKFSIAVVDDTGVCHGVAMVGRPVSRILDDGFSLEVNRCATDGTRNAGSKLYGAARRAVFAQGFTALWTYNLKTESGASLRGAGYRLIGEAGGGRWNRTNRPRLDAHPTERKQLWSAA